MDRQTGAAMNDAPTKYYFRQRQQNRLYDTVIHALEQAGVRRKDIAARMGIPPSQVTRLLTGPANWTSDTISDLLFAIDAELDFQVVGFRDRAKGNRFHPAGEPATEIILPLNVSPHAKGRASFPPPPDHEIWRGESGKPLITTSST